MREQFKRFCFWSFLILISWIICLAFFLKTNSQFFLAYLIFVPLVGIVMGVSVWLAICCTNENDYLPKRYKYKNDSYHALEN